MRSAGGRRAHSAASRSAASGSPDTRPAPRAPASGERASAGASTSRGTVRAMWLTAGPRRSDRLVMSTAIPAVPGSSGRIWSASAASSRTRSTLRSVIRPRKAAARSSSGFGDGVRVLSGGAQHRGQRLGRVTRPAAVARQVHVPPAVGESGTQPVAEVRGERALADAGRAGHDDRCGDGGGQFLLDAPDRSGASDEPWWVQRQLALDGPGGLGRFACGGGGCCRWAGRRRDRFGAAEHRPVQALQFRARVDAEFLGEHVSQMLVVGEGIGLPAAAVRGEHVLGGRPLVQRVGGAPLGEGRQQRGVLAHSQPQVGAVQFRGPLLLAEGFAGRVEPGGVDTGERFAPPQLQRLPEQCHRPRVVVALPGRSEQLAEPVHVDRRLVGGEHMSAALSAGDHSRQQPAQPGHVAVQGLRGALPHTPGPPTGRPSPAGWRS